MYTTGLEDSPPVSRDVIQPVRVVPFPKTTAVHFNGGSAPKVGKSRRNRKRKGMS